MGFLGGAVHCAVGAVCRKEAEGGGEEAAGPAHPDGRRRLRGHQGSTLHTSTAPPGLHAPPLHQHTSAPLHISTCRHSSRSLKPLVVKTSNSTLYITLNLNHYTHLQNVWRSLKLFHEYDWGASEWCLSEDVVEQLSYAGSTSAPNPFRREENMWPPLFANSNLPLRHSSGEFYSFVNL